VHGRSKYVNELLNKTELNYTELFEQYEAESGGFLSHFITDCDETWVYHYSSETK
jgi:hypothetical protein